jgi:AraC-like DNA-binding protein
LGYLCLSCDNLGEVFARSSRFYHLIWKGFQLDMSGGDDEITVKWCSAEQAPKEFSNALQILASIGMAGNIRLFRLLVGEEFTPRRVILPQPKPIESQSWEAFFNCPVEFENAATGWTIAASDLLLPIRHDNDLLRKSVERQMEVHLAHVVCNDDFLQTVQQLIVRSLHEGTPTIEHVAAAMSMSRTTLHRRIATRGSNYRQLLDDIRFSLAQVYLRDASLPLSGVGSLLGFSEQSSFHRSFRRRAGMSPGQFRKTQIQVQA